MDLLGNVWVSNRAEDGFSGGKNKGSVTRVGLVTRERYARFRGVGGADNPAGDA